LEEVLEEPRLLGKGRLIFDNGVVIEMDLGKLYALPEDVGEVDPFVQDLGFWLSWVTAYILLHELFDIDQMGPSEVSQAPLEEGLEAILNGWVEGVHFGYGLPPTLVEVLPWYLQPRLPEVSKRVLHVFLYMVPAPERNLDDLVLGFPAGRRLLPAALLCCRFQRRLQLIGIATRRATAVESITQFEPSAHGWLVSCELQLQLDR
jgi:hypothetical protein